MSKIEIDVSDLEVQMKKKKNCLLHLIEALKKVIYFLMKTKIEQIIIQSIIKGLF